MINTKCHREDCYECVLDRLSALEAQVSRLMSQPQPVDKLQDLSNIGIGTDM